MQFLTPRRVFNRGQLPLRVAHSCYVLLFEGFGKFGPCCPQAKLVDTSSAAKEVGVTTLVAASEAIGDCGVGWVEETEVV